SDTDENPKCAWEVTELSRQHRPDERAGPGNRREMMAKNDPLVRADKILSVIVYFARGGAFIVQHQDARGNPLGIEAVANRVAAKRGYQNESRIECFFAMPGDSRISPGTQRRDQHPNQFCANSFHETTPCIIWLLIWFSSRNPFRKPGNRCAPSQAV